MLVDDPSREGLAARDEVVDPLDPLARLARPARQGRPAGSRPPPSPRRPSSPPLNTVAARAEEASARTIGLVMARFFNQLITGNELDRLLDGPTNDVWIQPWLEHLRASGRRLPPRRRGAEIQVGAKGIDGVIVDRGHGAERIDADEYILATPIEVTRKLVPARLAARAPELANLRHLKTEWMNGIQFHLREPAPIVAGHVNYVDSPWALTSISQQQFWDDFDLAEDFGDGTVHDILSIDISNWDAPGIVHRKPATACTATRSPRRSGPR